jgi:hypothetical protein
LLHASNGLSLARVAWTSVQPKRWVQAAGKSGDNDVAADNLIGQWQFFL